MATPTTAEPATRHRTQRSVGVLPPDPNIPPAQYQPKDAIAETIKAATITTAAGVFVSTIQNTLTRQNVGAFGIFTRSGGTIAVFAAMGGAYEFSKCASANLREKDDVWNPTIGGFFAGSIMGLRFRSFPAMLGYGTALATILAAFTYTGGQINGKLRDASVDEISAKEYMRKDRRQPVEVVVHELGEGRGIYAPGYAQRRAERIKEAYGIDVTQPAPAVHPPSSS